MLKPALRSGMQLVFKTPKTEVKNLHVDTREFAKVFIL
jgi:hypothetical protein